jgi:C4-dicarboxylate transporter DctM subunit
MRTLSMSGVIPAFISAVALVAVCIWYGKKTGCDAGSERASRAEIWRAFKSAGPALLMPVIIIGGIWSGYFTPTESAAVAVVYGVAVSLFLYGDITWRDLPRLLLSAFQTSAVVMLVLGATAAMAWLLTAEQVAMQLAEWVKLVAHEQWVFLLLVNLSLLLLGIFIEPLPALLLTAPLFLPLAKVFNVDLVNLGGDDANLAIFTPRRSADAVRRRQPPASARHARLIPFAAATVLVLLLITYVQALSTTLVRLISTDPARPGRRLWQGGGFGGNPSPKCSPGARA